MAILREPMESKRFTQVPVHWSRDKRMSGKAKGYLAYIASHHHDYDLTVKQMIAEMADGPAAIYSGLKELEKFGYLKRHRQRGERGRLGGVDWEIIECPAPLPDDDSTTSRFSTRGEPTHGEATRGRSTTKNTTPKKITASEEESFEQTTSLSDPWTDPWAEADRRTVPNQRRERGPIEDRKFKTNGHRILARLGWNEAWSDFLLEELEARFEVNSMAGWIIAADKNDTLRDRLQEILDDYNAEHGTELVADSVASASARRQKSERTR